MQYIPDNLANEATLNGIRLDGNESALLDGAGVASVGNRNSNVLGALDELILLGGELTCRSETDE